MPSVTSVTFVPQLSFLGQEICDICLYLCLFLLLPLWLSLLLSGSISFSLFSLLLPLSVCLSLLSPTTSRRHGAHFTRVNCRPYSTNAQLEPFRNQNLWLPPICYSYRLPLDSNSKDRQVRSRQHNLLHQFKIPKIHAEPKCTDQTPRHKA